MKANELMIGDWVAYKHKYMSEALLCEVISIDAPHGEFILRYLQSDDIDEFGNKDYRVIKTRYEDTFSIPLTAEILEKNGGRIKNVCDGYDEWTIEIESNYSWWLLTITKEIDGGYEYNIDSFPIHYVHELQHALRLCGLDELADNFVM